MKRNLQRELKESFAELNEILEKENLTQEEREELELQQAIIAGKLLNPWLPVGVTRKMLSLSFFLVGFLGFFTQYQWLIYSFLIAGSFSPRLIGEIAFRFGKMSKKNQ